MNPPTYPALVTYQGHAYTPVPPDGYIQIGTGAAVPVQVVGGDAWYPVDPTGCAFVARGCPVCAGEEPPIVDIWADPTYPPGGVRP